jgi:single-strand DNA-binding protein
MLNKVVMIGRLVRDPELRNLAGNNVSVVNFTLAVDRPFLSKESGKREADFIDVVAWRKLAENCAAYLKKGNQAAVVGSLQVRSYDDSQGIRRTAAEVVADDVRFLGKVQAQIGIEVSSTGVHTEIEDDNPPF